MGGETNYTALGDATPAVAVVDAVPVTTTDRVEVIAPATLPGGYELHCDFHGRPLVVRVPPEGVKEGQQFVADVIGHGDEGSLGHRIPTGKWRDGCCDCFANGVCHPMLWLAWCCSPLAVGQIMTRMGLSATGREIHQDSRRGAYMSAFKVIACLFILFLAVDHTLSYIVTPYTADMEYTVDDAYGKVTPPDYSSVPVWVWVVMGIQYALQLAFGLYMLIVLIRTRAYVRQRYNIPEQHCGGCEDCCCAFWLPCCTTLQIARHTADYDTYHAACCTENGLAHNAPQVV